MISYKFDDKGCLKVKTNCMSDIRFALTVSRIVSNITLELNPKIMNTKEYEKKYVRDAVNIETNIKRIVREHGGQIVVPATMVYSRRERIVCNDKIKQQKIIESIQAYVTMRMLIL